MRGKKGVLHPDPTDPPRRRANKRKGHGTWNGDRPPILGVIGRESGCVRLTVLTRTTQAELEPQVLEATKEGTTVNTDEWQGYNHLAEYDRPHPTVNHNPTAPEWARDDDGDGIREVHCNTSEGVWTGVRNFLRPFRGVSKWFIDQYIAICEWSHNLATCTGSFLRALLVPPPCTSNGT